MIIGIDILDKYKATIQRRQRQVVFEPENEQKFEFKGEPKKKTKRICNTST